jgi:hypothetical protein
VLLLEPRRRVEPTTLSWKDPAGKPPAVPHDPV